ncbi:MAG: hemolysin family protein [Actinomycetota bacterium]
MAEIMTAETIAGFIALLILIFLAGFFSLAEAALITVTPVQARRMAEEKIPRGSTVLKLLEDRSGFLTTILLLTLVSQLSASSIAGTLSYKYFQSWGAAAATAVITLVIFIYCEVAPKTYAVENAERVVLRIAGPVYLLGKVFRPVVHFLTRLATITTRLLGIKTTATGPYMTEEELLTAVEIGEEEGVIEEEEKKMIRHIFEFGDTIVREVMMPRPDMICIKETETMKDALKLIMNEGHSRIPAYKDTIDNITGILYARDLLGRLAKGDEKIQVKQILRPAIFVPETKRVAELLREIQRDKIHLAVVIDEYGTTVGLATMEDLLEEIVGEIYDEYDLEDKQIEPLGEDSIRVEGRFPIDDVNEYFDVKLDYPDVDSIGGLMMELFGRLPERGETLQAAGLDFKVEKVVGRRVVKIFIKRMRHD